MSRGAQKSIGLRIYTGRAVDRGMCLLVVGTWCAMRIPFSLVVGVCAVVGLLLEAQTIHAKPNILIIVGDDMGYGDIGVHGCKDIPTPNIDSIAKNGIHCTNGYVSGPYCSPTRAGLMTGRYQTRFGHEFNPGPPPEGPDVGL